MQLYVKYNPYRLQTDIEINGNLIEGDHDLYRFVKGKRLQEWIGEFPRRLKDATNAVSFEVTFYGMEMDWDDFAFSFKQAKENGIVKKVTLEFVEGKAKNDIPSKIAGIFEDLQTGPIDDFRNPQLIKAFENVQQAVFPINVIATMSSGKSTLINSLLACKLMPSKNEACTATITEITDNDQDFFKAVAYDVNGQVLETVDNLTYPIMDKLNENEKVHRVVVEGDIPFIDAKTIALQLVDTPGPNNSQNEAHKQTTYSAVNEDANNLILYVLNGTQIGINDDAHLLDYVAEQIRKGGKQVRDRFLFVINKMDSFNPEEESIENTLEKSRAYLMKHGIEDPQIFLCSAYTALNIRTYLKDIDIAHMTFVEQSQLPSAALDTLAAITKFTRFPSMHLERYALLAPSAQREIDYRLNKAVEENDLKTQAIIHSGIYSIEAAITAYVKKYAQTKKIKDLVETFQEVLETNQVLANAKARVATDEEAARLCTLRAEAVRAKIADGDEAKKFKEQIASFNPMTKLANTVQRVREDVEDEVIKVFGYYDNVITNKADAKRLIMQFAALSSNSIAKLSAEMESIVNKEIVETGEALLQEYQAKLTAFDDSAQAGSLDFNTADLVQDALQSMRGSIDEWRTDSFAMEKVEKVGKTTTETKTYYEKVGEETEEIVTGSHDVKIGTRKVKVGSHREKVGTRKVKNPKKSFWQFWKDSYVDEDVYSTVDDYKDEDVYKTVLDYKTVTRDVFEERTKTIEKFTAKKTDIQADLVSKYRERIDDGMDKSLRYAGEQIESLKKQFAASFDELDKLITLQFRPL